MGEAAKLPKIAPREERATDRRSEKPRLAAAAAWLMPNVPAPAKRGESGKIIQRAMF
jgi:hypothetical protein